MAELYRYAAFLTYSSKDAAFARRLHAALEGFHIPKTLGHFDLAGKPNRVYPVFRDREELAAGLLGTELEAALRASNALIVVCSPNAVASPWVDTEVRYFLSLGRPERAFAIIAEGEPNASASGNPDQECFPAALREGPREWLAADARETKDGFRNAWLKVVAGLLSVNAGVLRDRDRQRRGRVVLLAIAGWFALAALIATGVGKLELSDAREAFTARAILLAERGERTSALPFALAGLGGDRPRAEAALETLGGRLRLVAVLDAPQPNAEMQLSSDGKILVTRSGNYELALWNTTDGTKRVPMHTAERFWFEEDGLRIVLYSAPSLEIVDVGSGASLAPREEVWAARLGDSVFVSGGVAAAQIASDSVRAWDVSVARPIATLESPGVRTPLFLSASGRLLVTCNDAGSCSVWDVRHQRKLAVLRSVYGDLAISATDDRIAAKSGYDTVTIWDATSGAVVRKVSIPGNVHSPIFSSDGTRLAVSSAGTRGQLLDSANGNLIADLGAVEEKTNAMTFSDDGSRLTVIGQGSTGTLWDSKSGKKLLAFDAKDSAALIRMSPNADRLLVQSFDLKTSLWDGSSGREIKDLGSMDRIESTMFSASNGPFFIRTINAGASIWTHEGQKVADLGPGSELDFQISKDGSRAAGFAGDGVVEIWDLSRPPIAGMGEELRSRICAANGRATPAFRRAAREGNDPVAAYLKGRPWRVCDWRGLGQAAGWVQTARYWAVKWGLLGDYRQNE